MRTLTINKEVADTIAMSNNLATKVIYIRKNQIVKSVTTLKKKR